eukprot:2986733-Pleurochrysis_carterae.AAC.1
MQLYVVCSQDIPCDLRMHARGRSSAGIWASRFESKVKSMFLLSNSPDAVPPTPCACRVLAGARCGGADVPSSDARAAAWRACARADGDAVPRRRRRLPQGRLPTRALWPFG